MEAVVLAGGFGTRLRDAVPGLPKPMAPVAGRPFLEILLASLARKGFLRVALSLGHMAEKVVAHFGDSFMGMDIVYEIERTPLGTGGAVRAAFDRLTADHVFVFNGDTYLDIEAEEVEALWLRDRRPVIVVREVPDTSRFGRIETRDGRVVRFSEKGVTGPGLINAGCYALPRSLLDAYPLGHPFSLETDFFARATMDISINAFISRGFFIDIGVPEDYARAQSELARFLP